MKKKSLSLILCSILILSAALFGMKHVTITDDPDPKGITIIAMQNQ